ncbi:hypothetical protein SBDP1_780005 [Syntrophobacter sp. SbD1]|nr:hypothetical protein SBDP1_780005 [Syntrophobacter sp. SbD1]
MKNRSEKHEYLGEKQKENGNKFFIFTFYLCILLMLSGCLGSLFSKGPAPDYYQIDYPFETSNCAMPISGAVRFWPFGASAPYDRDQMAVISPSLQVRFSSHYKWVSSAGDMVANNLMRDLSQAKVFEGIVAATNPMSSQYGISGQIYRFALEENGPSTRALLDLEISLWREKPRAVLFRKNFHYQSPPLTSTGPKEFASAMSGLVSQLSTDLRNDLCTITQGSSHPASD